MDDELYDTSGAERDAEFSQSLKSRRIESANRARLAKSRSGKRPDRPMRVDFTELEAIGARVRRLSRFR